MTESSEEKAAKEYATHDYRELGKVFSEMEYKAFLAGCAHKELEVGYLIRHGFEAVSKRDAAIAVMREALESIKQLDGKFGCESSDEAIEALAQADRILNGENWK